MNTNLKSHEEAQESHTALREFRELARTNLPARRQQHVAETTAPKAFGVIEPGLTQIPITPAAWVGEGNCQQDAGSTLGEADGKQV